MTTNDCWLRQHLSDTQVISGRTEQNVLVGDRGEEKRREELAGERKEVGRCWNEHKVLFGANMKLHVSPENVD